MAAPIVIKSSDSNMPVLNGAYGSLVNVIRTIVPLIGWDIVFDEANKIVIQARTGTRLLYRINDGGGTSNSASAEIRAYESMSDIDNGSCLVGPSYISKSKEVSINSRPWIISADDKFINIVIGIGGTQWSDSNDTYIGPSYCGFGDGVKVFNNINYSSAMIVGCCDTNSDPNTWVGFVGMETGREYFSWLHKSIDGTVSNIRTQFTSNSPFNMNCFGQSGKANLPLYPYAGNLLLSRPILPQGTDGYAFPHSYVPGLFNPLHRQESFTAGQEITDGSDTYFAIRSGWSGYWYGCALLKIGGEFRE